MAPLWLFVFYLAMKKCENCYVTLCSSSELYYVCVMYFAVNKLSLRTGLPSPTYVNTWTDTLDMSEEYKQRNQRNKEM